MGACAKDGPEGASKLWQPCSRDRSASCICMACPLRAGSMLPLQVLPDTGGVVRVCSAASSMSVAGTACAEGLIFLPMTFRCST